jgi:hypothetical protein
MLVQVALQPSSATFPAQAGDGFAMSAQQDREVQSSASSTCSPRAIGSPRCSRAERGDQAHRSLRGSPKRSRKPPRGSALQDMFRVGQNLAISQWAVAAVCWWIQDARRHVSASAGGRKRTLPSRMSWDNPGHCFQLYVFVFFSDGLFGVRALYPRHPRQLILNPNQSRISAVQVRPKQVRHV